MIGETPIDQPRFDPQPAVTVTGDDGAPVAGATGRSWYDKHMGVAHCGWIKTWKTLGKWMTGGTPTSGNHHITDIYWYQVCTKYTHMSERIRFWEGNVNHPADYESVPWMQKKGNLIPIEPACFQTCFINIWKQLFKMMPFAMFWPRWPATLHSCNEKNVWKGLDIEGSSYQRFHIAIAVYRMFTFAQLETLRENDYGCDIAIIIIYIYACMHMSQHTIRIYRYTFFPGTSADTYLYVSIYRCSIHIFMFCMWNVSKQILRCLRLWCPLKWAAAIPTGTADNRKGSETRSTPHLAYLADGGVHMFP